MKNNKGSFKNRIKGFYTDPGKFSKNRIKRENPTPKEGKEKWQEDKNFQEYDEDGLL